MMNDGNIKTKLGFNVSVTMNQADAMFQHHTVLEHGGKSGLRRA